MCGINGYVNISDSSLIKRMNKIIAHRGPNDSGFYFDGKAALGNRRLSIIDLKGGHQPIHNENQDIWITFNGEIYNFPDLRIELEKLGHRFYTHTDTEAIIHLYEEYGENCVKKLRGMFAFAIWDSRTNKLFLARDRLGKKPLYYYLGGNSIVFSSEIKAILENHEILREIDMESLSYYFTYKYVPGPKTMFKNIFKLLPGYSAVYRDGKFSAKKYWDLELKERKVDIKKYIEEFRDTLKESVRIRLISEVPIGVYLSGGIDSSTIVALMRGLDADINTFTVAFEDDELDESEYARFVAEEYSTKHREIAAKPDVIKKMPQIVWYLDEPVADDATLTTYAISEATKKYVKVVLTGDGGDELSAGYGYYKKLQKIKLFSKFHGLLNVSGATKISRRARRLHEYSKMMSDVSLAYQKNFQIFHEDEKTDILGQLYKKTDVTRIPKLWLEGKASSFLNEIMHLDVKMKLADDFLMKIDKMCMANSIESRCPFLDYNLVNLSFQLSPEIKLSEPKYLLRRTMKGILPDKIIYRQKHGFNAPTHKWTESLDIENLLKDSPLNYNKEYVKKLVQKEDAERLWVLLNFELWNRIYIHPEKVRFPLKPLL